MKKGRKQRRTNRFAKDRVVRQYNGAFVSHQVVVVGWKLYHVKRTLIHRNTRLVTRTSEFSAALIQIDYLVNSCAVGIVSDHAIADLWVMCGRGIQRRKSIVLDSIVLCTVFLRGLRLLPSSRNELLEVISMRTRPSCAIEVFPYDGVRLSAV